MKTQHLIAIVFAAILGAYILFSLVFFPSVHTTAVCREVNVSVQDAGKRNYVTSREIQDYLLSSCGSLVGDTVNYEVLASVEALLLKHPLLRTAEAWCSPQGVLHVSVTQRQPALRVMGDENYYVDSDRKRMPVRATTAAYVPVVTGRVPFHFAANELYDFILWIEDDAYWRAQIEQINVVSPKRIEIIPRVGSGVVVLGSLDNYSGKLSKLRRLYQDGFSSFGWNEYAEVDLRFRGQVVCRK